MEKIDGAIKMAKRAVALKYEDLSDFEAQRAKQSIMDCLGVMIAGTTLGGKCKDVANLMIKNGGVSEATVIGLGAKLPLESAAVANGGFAHTLDYDDAIDASGIHPAAGALPAALACCELKGASGKELIESFVVGADMVARLGLCSPKSIIEMGWLGPQLKAAYGSAVAAGKALGFDEEKMVNCIGLMLQQTSGTSEVLDEGGNDCRELYQCFAQKHGMFAAELAAAGIRGPKNSFEGPNGLFHQYFDGRGATDYSYVDVDEHSPWICSEATYKPWSSCRCTHGFIDGMRQLMKKHGFTGADVKSVKLGVGKLGCSLCQPYDVRYTPQVSADARFSIPFTVANTLVHGNVTLANFTEEGMHDEKVLEMAKKIEWYADEELLNDPKGVESAKTTVILNDGTEYYIKMDEPLGGMGNPMSEEDVINKFKDCCSHAYKPMSDEKVEKLIDMCLHLEEVEDIRDIITLCS